MEFVNWLSSEEKNQICLDLTKNDRLKQDLFKLIDQPRFYPYCQILSYMVLSKMTATKCEPIDNIKQHLELAKNEPDDVKYAVLQYVMNSLNYAGLATQTNEIEKILEILHEMVQPIHCDQLR